MMELTSVIAAVLLAMQAQPDTANQAETQAAPSSAETSASTAQAADPDDKIICRRTAIVGSKFKKKICGTKKQWQTLASRGVNDTRDLQRSGKGSNPSTSLLTLERFVHPGFNAKVGNLFAV